ncbi:MAG: MBL fold metallo-hydrolase [Candidatus Curtissbacteria bacterium]
MKIKLLGTSAGWPLPRLGCNCEICSSKDEKDTRTRTQLLVDDSILIDAGPDTYKHLKKVDTGKIKAILVSHEHPDHTLGFWDLTHIYNGAKPIDVYVTLPVLAGIRKYIGIHGQHLKVHVKKPNEPFTIDHIKVEYFPVVHGKTPAFGIKLKQNKIFIYITDFNRILPSQEKTVKHADYWAIDGSTLGKLGQTQGHISINDGIQLTKKYKVKNTYFIHIGHKTGTHKFLENYLKENAGPNFHVAYDNLEIKI